MRWLAGAATTIRARWLELTAREEAREAVERAGLRRGGRRRTHVAAAGAAHHAPLVGDAARAACQKLGIDYVPVHTDQPLDRVLFDFLQRRLRRGKSVRRQENR